MYVVELMDGLLTHPQSLYRAAWLRDNPQKPDPAQDPSVLQFLGWTQDTRVLLGMHNLLAAFVAGKKSSDYLLSGPTTGPKPGPRLVAATLAEFTEAGMFAAMDDLARNHLLRN